MRSFSSFLNEGAKPVRKKRKEGKAEPVPPTAVSAPIKGANQDQSGVNVTNDTASYSISDSVPAPRAPTLRDTLAQVHRAPLIQMPAFAGPAEDQEFIPELSQELLQRYAKKAGASKEDAWKNHDAKTIMKRQASIPVAHRQMHPSKKLSEAEAIAAIMGRGRQVHEVPDEEPVGQAAPNLAAALAGYVE